MEDLLAVAFATSGSRGHRLLFFYPTDGKSSKVGGAQILHEIPPHLLGELLVPDSPYIDKTFTLSVDNYKFVGYPKNVEQFKVRDEARALSFNTVFILKSSSKKHLVAQCQDLSAKFGICLKHEESRCGFVSQEVQILINKVDYSNLQNIEDFKLVYSSVTKDSLLAKHIANIFNSVRSGEGYINERINHWSCITWQPLLSSHPRSATSVQPYHSFLILKDVDSIILSLPQETRTAFSKLLSLLSPVKTLDQLAQDTDLPLSHVLRLVGHLVQWKSATVIQPLTETNMYMLSSDTDLTRDSKDRVLFESTFESVPFLDLVVCFSDPLPLIELQGDFQQREFVSMVAWLLQHCVISQLKTYVFLVPTVLEEGELEKEIDTFLSEKDVDEARKLVDSLKTQVSPVELKSVLKCPSAQDLNDLSSFNSLVKYFRGKHSIFDIAHYEQIPRTYILTVVDKFSEILVTATIPDAN